MGEFAEGIGEMAPTCALSLGVMVDSVSEIARVTTRRQLNGAAAPVVDGIAGGVVDLIVRSHDFFTFRHDKPALALLDFDTKGMPATVKAQIAALGGFWKAMVSIMPGIGEIARVQRASTSAGLYHGGTGERFPNNGAHIYVAVADGSDIPRFLTVLHQRCWLAGFGWMMLGAAGQMLERSIIDFVVGSPERLVFEGPPRLAMPLKQDLQMRLPVAVEGELLDTAAECPPLSLTEEMKLRQLLAQERVRVQPEADQARRRYVSATAKRFGVSEWRSSAAAVACCGPTLRSSSTMKT
jgi:hypothetical protein